MNICSICQRCYEDAVAHCEEHHGSLDTARTGSPEMIENYRLDFLLERDAAGETYSATHTTHKQTSTVRIIAADASGATANQLTRLQSEARIAAGIQHPNVARIYESGWLPDGDFYVVSEAVGGQTLQTHLRNAGALSEAEAVAVAKQTAEALAAAHAVGLVHRAVTPANIILENNEENRLSVKLHNFDFGATRQQIVAGNSKIQMPTDAQRYLSPEQCAGETVDTRTDVFSLGVVFYEMLCGHSPFAAPLLPANGEQQINEQPLLRLRYDVRALIAYLLKQSLQTGAAARLSSADNFARQLRQIELLVAPPKAMRKTSGLKNSVSGAAMSQTPNESLIENFQPRSIIAPETADAVIPASFNSSVYPSLKEEIEMNAVSENLPDSEPQAIYVEGEKIGIEPTANEPILVERKTAGVADFDSEPILVRKKENDFNQFKSDLILVKRKQVNSDSREASAFIPTISDESPPVIRDEQNFVESAVPQSFEIPVVAKKPKAQPPLLAFDDSYTPPHTPKIFMARQRALLVGAALLALLTAVGLADFLYNQPTEPLNLERAAVIETPNTAVSPAPTISEVNQPTVAAIKPAAAENQKSASIVNPSVAENAPEMSAKPEVQNQPRPPVTTNEIALLPEKTSENNPPTVERPAEIERASVVPSAKAIDGDEQTKLNSSLANWITATNERDVERQMTYYAPKVDAYYLARNASPESVRAEKKRIFERANVIDIQTGKPEITVSGDGRRATMRFRKKYAIKEGEKNRRGEVIQELQWVKSSGDWKIVSERDVKVINR